jgi:hypothetical protein
MNKKCEKSAAIEIRLAVYAVYSSYTLMVIAGLVNFEIWKQILDLWEENISPDRLSLLAPHALRYSIIWPILQIATIINWPADRVFSYIVALLVIATARTVEGTRAKILNEKYRHQYPKLMIAIIFPVISLFMNGRLVFSFLGIAILVDALISWDLKLRGSITTLLRVTIAFWLTSVSTGTFGVAVSSVALWAITVATRIFRRSNLRNLMMVAAVLISFFAISPLVSAYAIKNINYYGGGLEGVYNMLGHGPGAYLKWLGPVGIALAGMFISPLVLLLLQWTATRGPTIAPQICVIASAISIGIFGYSTLLAMVPAVVLQLSIRSTLFRKVSAAP